MGGGDKPRTMIGGQTILSRVNPIGTTSDTRPWTVCAAGQTSGCDLNGDLLPQINELGASTGYPLGTTNRYATDLKWPISNEYSAEIQQQFPMNLVVSVGFTHRETRRNIALQNLAVPFASYIPLTVTEASSGKQVTGLSPQAAERLLAYAWPGNVRELENCIERAIALAQHDQILPDDLPEKIRDYRRSHVLVASDDPAELVPLEEVERRYILRVLEAVGGNKSQAAQVLGLGRKTLYRKLEEYGEHARNEHE